MVRPISVEKLISVGNSVKKPRFVSKKLKERSLHSNETVNRIEHKLRWKQEESKSDEELENYIDNTLDNDNSTERAQNLDLRALARQSAHLLRKREDEIEDYYMGKHWSQKKIDEMTSRDWRILCEDFNIVSKGGFIQKPLRNWDELDIIPPEILNIITKNLGYAEPTPIQRSTVPNVMENRDFIGVASTGSGKTLAFLIPILIKLSKIPPLNSVTKLDGPVALILAPTRELAQQIEQEAKKITSYWKRQCFVASIVGGHSLEQISTDLRDGCDILVATPGRLIDCIDSHIILLRQVEILVLDEADKMIDFGFEEQLTTILAKTETLPNRQTMMFTATMSPTIEKVANGYLKKPSYVSIGGGNSKPKIKQILEYVPQEEERFNLLCKSIIPRYGKPIIIFINYKKTVDWLLDKFKESRFRVTTLHGSKSQEQREQSIRLLRNGKIDILIATDVAGRGIDIPDVSLVVNFQMSKKLDNYVHRIGRTGRAGKVGTAITFLSDYDDETLVSKLFDYVKKNDSTGENFISSETKKKFNVDKSKHRPIIF